jgi:hypothetical protein
MCVLQTKNQSMSKIQKLKLNPKLELSNVFKNKKLEFYSKQKICVCSKTKLQNLTQNKNFVCIQKSKTKA